MATTPGPTLKSKAYQQRHPLGTTARLALELLLYTGTRRSDLVRLGRSNEKPGKNGMELHFRPFKGRNKKNPVMVEIPLLPALAAVLAVNKTGDLAYLVTERGLPFTTAGFGNWFHDRCEEAGLTGCSAHGLRKASATTCANNGATTYQLMAIFGWKSMAQAELYTRMANRRKLAASGMATLNRIKTGT
jgi:integrase